MTLFGTGGRIVLASVAVVATQLIAGLVTPPRRRPSGTSSPEPGIPSRRNCLLQDNVHLIKSVLARSLQTQCDG
jgi:hypothetical protein